MQLLSVLIGVISGLLALIGAATGSMPYVILAIFGLLLASILQVLVKE